MTQRDATNILDEVISIIDDLTKEYQDTGATLASRIDEIKPHVIKTGRDADMLQALLDDLKANHAGRDVLSELKCRILGIQPFNRPTDRFINRCVDIAITSQLEKYGTRPVLVSHFIVFIREIMVNEGYDAESIMIWNGLDKDIVSAIKQHDMVSSLHKARGGIAGNEIWWNKPEPPGV